MKKLSIILLVTLSLACTTVEAQKIEKKRQPVTFGIQAGANMNKFTGKDDVGDKVENEFKPGFHLGVNLEIPLFPGFYFQPGIQFISKGSRNNNSDFTFTSDLYYAEMPLYFVIKPQTGKGYFMIGAGADISYGLGGKWKYDESGSTQNDEDGNVKFKSTVDPYAASNGILYLRPIDVAVGLFFGYQLKNGIFFQLNGQYGLINRIPNYSPANPSDASNYKNIGVGLSVGYRFGKK